MNYVNLEGVHELIEPEYRIYSPLFGLTALNTFLKNRRFFGNYGEKQIGIGCLEGTNFHEALRLNKDCPQDYTSELVQRLFPSQDHVNLVANQISVDFVSNLGFEVIGKILGKIAQFKGKDLNNKNDIETLTEDLKNILFVGSAPEKFIKFHKELDKNPDSIDVWINHKENDLEECKK